jgi:uncharacterized membrane protein YoaK (UPF0700 family)
MNVDAAQPQLTAYSLRLACLLAASGGYLDAFTFLGHGGVFANAQTGNVVLLGVYAATRHWHQALLHLPPLAAFVIGVFVAETLNLPVTERLVLHRPVRAALIVEIVVLAVIAALPRDFPGVGIVLSVAFAAALQNATFRKLRRWSVTTVMTTGNLRTATIGLYQWLVRHTPGAAEQSRCFFAVVLSFLIGAAGGGLVTAAWHNVACCVPAAVLLLGLGLFVYDEPRAADPDEEEVIGE